MRVRTVVLGTVGAVVLGALAITGANALVVRDEPGAVVSMTPVVASFAPDIQTPTEPKKDAQRGQPDSDSDDSDDEPTTVTPEPMTVDDDDDDDDDLDD